MLSYPAQDLCYKARLFTPSFSPCKSTMSQLHTQQPKTTSAQLKALSRASLALLKLESTQRWLSTTMGCLAQAPGSHSCTSLGSLRQGNALCCYMAASARHAPGRWAARSILGALNPGEGCYCSSAREIWCANARQQANAAHLHPSCGLQQAAHSSGAEAPWINLALRWLLSGNPKEKATG